MLVSVAKPSHLGKGLPDPKPQPIPPLAPGNLYTEYATVELSNTSRTDSPGGVIARGNADHAATKPAPGKPATTVSAIKVVRPLHSRAQIERDERSRHRTPRNAIRISRRRRW